MSEPTTPVAPLEIRGLVRRYGGFTAVNNLDLVVSSGEIVGFLGPTAAGHLGSARIAPASR